MVKGFKVLHPGILTTYQDHGRRSGLQFGIPRSGAMDSVALRAANLLVGNSESEVGLEVTLMGLRLAILPLVIAIAGADLLFTINSEYRPLEKLLCKHRRYPPFPLQGNRLSLPCGERGFGSDLHGQPLYFKEGSWGNR